MKPTATLATAETPEGHSLALLEHDGRYFLQLDGIPVQSSFAHGAASELGRLACAPFRPTRRPQILLGGLGLGYTLAAVRDALPQKRAAFLVAEPVAELPGWHHRFLEDLHPGQLDDPRLEIRREEPARALGRAPDGYHAILLDIEGSAALPGVTDRSGLPGSSFLHRAHSALKQGGLLAMACSKDGSSPERRLRQAGFDVAHESVPASHKGKQKRRSTIWLARKGGYQK